MNNFGQIKRPVSAYAIIARLRKSKHALQAADIVPVGVPVLIFFLTLLFSAFYYLLD
ncbi:hypothetical protein CHISP_1203 [Chitinispirillum alkaliphilum]|nr:hypothetical protein CHISP_1203 [Chitinispirillum alkaliphilum]